MTSKIDPQSIDTIILEALKQEDKNRGQLFDLTGKNYPVLGQALRSLQSRELIEIYFAPGETVPVLTYRLRSGN
ncbi:MAG: hypothetical protein HC772_10220 [Leptolyngbyaceae cyanobacterium CRU_2_3]|nr:hypothetical protein [Leptolyngbyaceae cyanobacterium CRU_2_3]